MKTIPINKMTAGVIGLLTATSLGIVQEAQAATVRSSSVANFENVTLNLVNPDGTTNLIPLFFNTIEGNGSLTLDGNSDSDFFAAGPSQCPVSLSDTSNASVPNGFANSGAGVNCADISVIEANNFAEIEMTGNQGEARAIGAYTIFSDTFQVNPGDLVDLSGSFSAEVLAEIIGWTPETTKTAAADFLGTYEIFVDDEVVFQGPRLDLAVALVNQNGLVMDSDSGPLDGIDFEVPEGVSGLARIQLSAREQASGSIARDVPEPSALIGLSAIGVGALLSRKKKNNANN